MGIELKKKYGLWTATAMVIGIVIGSGVFFKGGKILSLTGGNLPLGILAWLVGGLIMVICANAFAVMATKYEYVNGAVDYAEATMGKVVRVFYGLVPYHAVLPGHYFGAGVGVGQFYLRVVQHPQ